MTRVRSRPSGGDLRVSSACHVRFGRHAHRRSGAGGPDAEPRTTNRAWQYAVGTVIGAGLGTSTVTAYVASATGVAASGRTGLTALVVAGFFFFLLFFSPIVAMVCGGYQTDDGMTLYPVITPALIVVGTFMVRGVRRIDWDDSTVAIPAFLMIMLMPLTVSITDGIAFGFISFSLLKLVTGHLRKTDWLIVIFAVLFLVRYLAT